MTEVSNSVFARHIQDHNQANATQEHHWGYASRVLPCTSGEGTCAYLDAVYWMHDVSMLYTFIMWGVLLGIAVVWVTLRGWRMGGPAARVGGLVDGLCDAMSRVKRRYLMADAPLTYVFGRVTRLQVAVLATLLGYLLIFSLVGIVYKTWVTPIKGTPYHNTRTGLGGFSDRVGALAYALTPLTVLLGTRESILTIITGIPYQHFNFLHRWCGRIIFVQSVIHTIGWTIIEGKLYQPQPKVYGAWLNQFYMIFGCVALFFIFFLTVFSTKRMIRYTGYEFFKVTHSAVAVLYIGACWGHWDRLWCWMVPSLILMALDQAVRLARTCTTHIGTTAGRFGFHRAMATVQAIGGGESEEDVCIRLDFDFEHEAWLPGQHFYLCFPSLSIWQSHPFTVASSPDASSKSQHHTYLLRARKGQTAEFKALAGQTITTVMTGPYGPGLPGDATPNVLTVAGGTGVTFTLPIVFESLRQSLVPQSLVEFVWVVRHAEDLLWLDQELGHLKSLLHTNPGLYISIFVTREQRQDLDPSSAAPIAATTITNDPEKTATSSSSSLSNYKSLQGLLLKDHDRFSIEYVGQRPSMSAIIDTFMERANKRGGYIQVFGSGPDSMDSDVRKAVSNMEEKDGLKFYWDSRE